MIMTLLFLIQLLDFFYLSSSKPLSPLDIPRHQTRSTQQSPLCTNGQVWQELHISAGQSVSLELSGRGDEFLLNCLSGFVWDVFSGHPKYSLQLYNINSGQSVDLTNLINTTNWSNPTGWASSVPGQWGLQVQNNNGLWNADFTLVIDYFIRPTPPACTVCLPGQAGASCNESCSANCYQCCQNSPSVCTVCAAGKSWLPSCNASCIDGCLYCDDMAGCHVCANPLYSGPNCNQCRPAPCYLPNITNCIDPCSGIYPWCDLCGEVVEKALSISETLVEAFVSEEEAAAAMATAEIACLFLPPFVDIACEFAVVGVTEGLTVTYFIKWSGTEVANKLLTKEFCEIAHLCA